MASCSTVIMKHHQLTRFVSYSMYGQTALITINASKIIIIAFALQTNTDDIGGFLQVQHYLGMNICCKVPNIELRTRN